MILGEKLTYVPGQQSLAIKEQKKLVRYKVGHRTKKSGDKILLQAEWPTYHYLIFEVCRCCEQYWI